MPIGFRAPLANTRQAQYQLLRQRAFLQQIVHQTTHSLARFFLEVDANYKQFRTAQRLRAAAQQRLEAQRAFYEEGRITIDRLLDAVSQYANAIAQEAQYKTSYNTSIAALEEAKGTLLAYDNIAVAEGPSPRKAYIQAKDQRAGHGQFHVPLDGSYRPQPINGPPHARHACRRSRRPTPATTSPRPSSRPGRPPRPPADPDGPDGPGRRAELPLAEPRIARGSLPTPASAGPAGPAPNPAPATEEIKDLGVPMNLPPSAPGILLAALASRKLTGDRLFEEGRPRTLRGRPFFVFEAPARVDRLGARMVCSTPLNDADSDPRRRIAPSRNQDRHVATETHPSRRRPDGAPDRRGGRQPRR